MELFTPFVTETSWSGKSNELSRHFSQLWIQETKTNIFFEKNTVNTSKNLLERPARWDGADRAHFSWGVAPRWAAPRPRGTAADTAI